MIRNHHGKDVGLAITLVMLGLLFLALWFADPVHRTPGKSRVGWPPAATAP